MSENSKKSFWTLLNLGGNNLHNYWNCVLEQKSIRKATKQVNRNAWKNVWKFNKKMMKKNEIY
jgi:hypothetical protein